MTRRNHSLPNTQAELDALIEWANEATRREYDALPAGRPTGVVTLFETVRSWNGMGEDIDDHEIAWGNVDHVFFALCQRIQQELGR